MGQEFGQGKMKYLKISCSYVLKSTSYLGLASCRDGPPPDFSGIPDYFFLPPWKKKNLSPASWLFFCLGKIGGIIRHYCRPATKYKISRSRSIRISRFHVWKSQVFVLFPNWKKKKASHFVACLQAHKAWAKNKFYDRLNWRPWLNPLHTVVWSVYWKMY